MKQRSVTTWLLMPMAFGLFGCMGELPVVGLDDNGKPIETMIPQRKYVAQLSESMERMQQSVLPAVDSETARQLSGLRTARLGLGLKGEVGIGDYFKLGGNIGFRLGFTNKP